MYILALQMTVRELNNSQQMVLYSGTELSIARMLCNDKHENENEEADDTIVIDREMDEISDAVWVILFHGNESCIITLECVAARMINFVVKNVVNT